MTRPAFYLLHALLAAQLGSQICLADEHSSRLAPLPELHYIDRQSLPNFEIGGRPARIHTQGLFVTDRYYYVTGRLERNPRRPLLVRFDRANLSAVEHVDLLVASGAAVRSDAIHRVSPFVVTRFIASLADDAALDHPGGFDFDGRSFWIPLAASRPNSNSLIVRVRPEPGQPLAAAKAKSVFRLDDHIGAIACDITTGRLYGANWDTRLIYVWNPDGTLIEKFPQTDLSPKNPDRAFAVQDWKGLGNQRILAGASDKNPRRRPAESKAVLQLLDMATHREAALIRLTSPPDRDILLTHEGMALSGDHVFFLPADLGTNAEVLRYRWSKPLSCTK